jgi:hypothetical protein
MALGIPFDIQEGVVIALGSGCPATLRKLSLASRGLNGCARSILFQHVRILSLTRLLRLASVLHPYRLVTIPTTTTTLHIELRTLESREATLSTKAI